MVILLGEVLHSIIQVDSQEKFIEHDSEDSQDEGQTYIPEYSHLNMR